MNKRCEWCDSILLNTKSPRRKFCNDICRARYRRSKANETGTYKVKCACCGEVFRTYHDTKKYCSNECRYKSVGSHSSKRSKIILEKKCNECGNEYQTNSKAQRFCSSNCKTKYNSRLKDLKRRKYYIDGDNTITLAKLINKEKNICYICQQECEPNDYTIDDKGTIISGNRYPSIDHVMPLSKGGKHEWNNIKLAHRICNIKKSNSFNENLA